MAITEKLLVRVLDAVEAGADTSALVAQALYISSDAAAWYLKELWRCGCVSREQERRPGPGRPFYRYRISEKNLGITER